MTLYVDHHALDGIARALDQAGADLDATSTSVPGDVDAGEGAAAIHGILARMTEDAGELVTGLSAASAAVTQANTAYTTQDVATADASNNTAWGD
jgi:uncharacterized protein YukE